VDWARLILLAHAASTGVMAGLIWFVQIVHYPLFAKVGEGGFAVYEAEHQRRTTLVVGPAMVIELASAVIIVAAPGPAPEPALAWLGLGLLAVLWLSTAAVQAPLHRRLEGGLDGSVIRMLVASNWIRTCAWSARFGIALWLLSAGGVA